MRRIDMKVLRVAAMLPAAVVLGSVGASAVGSGSVSACSCMELTEVEAFDQSTVVFTGTLVEIVETPVGEDGSFSSTDPTRFVFDVDTVFKGDATDVQTVVTARDGASCGLEIRGPGPFVVFAGRGGWPTGGDELTTGLCSGTRPLVAGPLPAEFGPGRAPSAPPTTTPDPAVGAARGPAVPWVITAVAGTALIAIAVGGASWRRRRPLRAARRRQVSDAA